MRKLDFVLTEQENGRLVGKLVKSLCHVSAGQYAKIKTYEGVLLDGVSAHANQRVRAGQTLSLLMPEENKQGERGDLPIVYEDEDLLVIDKPAPLSTMRSPYQENGSLEEMVLRYLPAFRPVNRLDKGTSGLMVIAKNAYAQSVLQGRLHSADFVRVYLAIVEGEPEQERGSIELPIGKISEDSVKRAVRPEGKSCRTDYEVLERGNGRSLVRLYLSTGRTHQIRVHMAALGTPVAGDYLYGTPLKGLPNRFALHSTYLRLFQPVSGKLIECTSPMPEMLMQLLKSGA